MDFDFDNDEEMAYDDGMQQQQQEEEEGDPNDEMPVDEEGGDVELDIDSMPVAQEDAWAVIRYEREKEAPIHACIHHEIDLIA
jgi:hypothetical protein